MSTPHPAGPPTSRWVARQRRPGGNNRTRAFPRRHDHGRAHSVGAFGLTALLFGLSAAALVYGGRAAIAPMLRTSSTAPAATTTGSIVMAMPDGILCRNMSFDNTTGVVSPRGVEPCVSDVPAEPVAAPPSKFQWGKH